MSPPRVGKWRYSSTILDFSTKWRWLVNFKLRQHYHGTRWTGARLDAARSVTAPADTGNRTQAIQLVPHRYTDRTVQGTDRNYSELGVRRNSCNIRM
jgi:hypothetical protein